LEDVIIAKTEEVKDMKIQFTNGKTEILKTVVETTKYESGRQDVTLKVPPLSLTGKKN